MATATVVPIRTLYTVEEDLLALLDCLETVQPDQERQYILDLAKAMAQARSKRDSVAQYMAHCEDQIEFAKAEIERLRARRASFEASLDRLKRYMVTIMESLQTRTMEGNAVTFSLRKCPPSVEVLDDVAVPPAYKTASLEVPGTLAEQILDSLPMDAPVSLDWKVDKRAIKDALVGGLAIPGAALAAERNTVIRK